VAIVFIITLRTDTLSLAVACNYRSVLKGFVGKLSGLMTNEVIVTYDNHDDTRRWCDWLYSCENREGSTFHTNCLLRSHAVISLVCVCSDYWRPRRLTRILLWFVFSFSCWVPLLWMIADKVLWRTPYPYELMSVFCRPVVSEYTIHMLPSP